MGPRVRLNDEEAARLPALLQFTPAHVERFARCTGVVERVLWLLDAYAGADRRPLSPNLIALLASECGASLAPESVAAALREAAVAGWVSEAAEGWSLAAAGRDRLAASP